MRKFFGPLALTLCAALTMSFASCSSGSSDSEEKTGPTAVTTESPENVAVTTYTVTFDSDGGSEVASQTVESGKTATKPADPAKSGEKTSYAFLGWYNGDSAFDFASTIESDVTLKAKWIEGFAKVTGTTIKGDETWTPSSDVFVSGRSLTIADLYVCDHEVTQSEYKKYCKYVSSGPRDTYGKGDNFPAYYVNWYDAVVYCNLRSMDEGLTPCYTLGEETDPSKWSGILSTTTGDVTKYCGPSRQSSAWDGGIIMNTTANGYRLPTEAEWEYIAREGKTSGTTYSGSNTIGDVAWYGKNSGSKSHEVKTDKLTGTDSANALGIYDMSGNVWEWCWDWNNGIVHSDTGASGASSGNNRVRRGASWFNSAYLCEVAYRYSYDPSERYNDVGFRLVRSSQ